MFTFLVITLVRTELSIIYISMEDLSIPHVRINWQVKEFHNWTYSYPLSSSICVLFHCQFFLRHCFNSKVSSCPHFTSCPWQVFTINILFQLVLGKRNFQCCHIFPSVLRGKYCRGTTHVKENMVLLSKHGTFILSSPQGPFLLEALCLIFKIYSKLRKKMCVTK